MIRAVRQVANSVAILALVASCSRPGPSAEGRSSASSMPFTADASADWLAQRAASALAKIFRASGLQASEQGKTVLVGLTTVDVAARINNSLEQQGRHILAAEFQIAIDRQPMTSLFTGAIGIDASREAARERTLEQWAAQYGVPIGFAIASRLGATRPPTSNDGPALLYAKTEIQGVSIFHGPPGIRGAAKDPSVVSSEDFVRQVANTAFANLEATAEEYRTATIQVVVSGTAVTSGECRLNGAVAPGLLSDLEKLSWPAGDPSYMYKLYLVAPKRADR